MAKVKRQFVFKKLKSQIKRPKSPQQKEKAENHISSNYFSKLSTQSPSSENENEQMFPTLLLVNKKFYKICLGSFKKHLLLEEAKFFLYKEMKKTILEKNKNFFKIKISIVSKIKPDFFDIDLNFKSQKGKSKLLLFFFCIFFTFILN